MKVKKVKILKSIAGPIGAYGKGSVEEFDAKIADSLIKHGLAVEIKAHKTRKKTTKVKDIETPE